MKNLKSCLILLVSCFIFSNCEQESIQSELVASTYEKLDLQTAKVTATEQIYPEVISSELESRDGREKIYEYEGTVYKNYWIHFYFEKKYLDPNCKYYAVLTPIHGNANLYVHAREDDGDWREIRYSNNEHTQIEEIYGEYIDLEEHESFLYFNVHGVDETAFKIELYRLCETDIYCNCPTLDQPVIGCDGQEYSNACAARCAGEYCDDYGEGRPSLSFKKPREGQHFDKREDVYVKVDADDHDGIEFVKLYVNNEFVRQENNDPYEWDKPHVDNDYPLNNMQTGTYKIVAVAVDHHGNQTVKHINISVGEGFCNCPNNYDPVIGCDGKEYSNACVAECNGQYCPDSGANNIQLEFITPIEPEHNVRFKAGIDLFVKVDAKDDEAGIEEVKLYVNGKYLRSEYHAPYEWGKPHRDDDHLLNNLSAGGYELTAVAINKDGKQKSETIRIGVR